MTPGARRSPPRRSPDIVATCLALDGGTLYAFATQFHDGAPDSVVLVALDSDTMAVRSRHPLPLAPGPVASAVVHGGKLYYPLTANESPAPRAMRSRCWTRQPSPRPRPTWARACPTPFG
ncbi:MAG: hypothetical protein IPH03_08605 [Tetrasphaera sp.]|nr:hypothetical protein [Tetrasphaera sp.]